MIDLSEAYCAKVYEDKDTDKIFHITSGIPNKHRQGGQSAQRFARIREQKIVEYFKRINEKISDIEGKIVIAISFVYQNRFNKYLSSQNKSKIVKNITTEYGGLAGVYQARDIQI